MLLVACCADLPCHLQVLLLLLLLRLGHSCCWCCCCPQQQQQQLRLRLQLVMVSVRGWGRQLFGLLAQGCCCWHPKADLPC
jgi:hypothetical protein